MLRNVYGTWYFYKEMLQCGERKEARRRNLCDSPHLQLNNKAIRHAKSEYNRVFSETAKAMKFGDKSENDMDIGNTKKASSKPKRKQEKLAIAEFCQLNDVCVEVVGRIYSQDELWKSLSKITTPLKIESDAAKSSRWMRHVLSDEERALSNIADDIFSEHSQKKSDKDALEDVDLNVSIDFCEIGEGGIRDDGDDTVEVDALGTSDDAEVVVEEEAIESSDGNDEILARVGKSKKKVSVRKAAVNELSLCDVFTVANVCISEEKPQDNTLSKEASCQL